jgi:hypothetical protein
MRGGQPEQGSAVVEEALSVIEARGERLAEVELYRLARELSL